MARVAVEICYFAWVRDRLGRERDRMHLPAQVDEAELRRMLGEQEPLLMDMLGKCRIAHNHAFVRGGVELVDGDELALIPPVSGG